MPTPSGWATSPLAVLWTPWREHPQEPPTKNRLCTSCVRVRTASSTFLQPRKALPAKPRVTFVFGAESQRWTDDPGHTDYMEFEADASQQINTSWMMVRLKKKKKKQGRLTKQINTNWSMAKSLCVWTNQNDIWLSAWMKDKSLVTDQINIDCELALCYDELKDGNAIERSLERQWKAILSTTAPWTGEERVMDVDDFAKGKLRKINGCSKTPLIPRSSPGHKWTVSH